MNLMLDYDNIEQRRPFVVFLRGKWDDHERQSIRLLAYGPKDAKGLAEDLYPDFLAVRVEATAS